MDMIEFLKAVLFGIVEGVTEWLPISSTGHMIILDEVVKLNVSEEFLSMFLVVIQLGAILAVVLLFWNQLFPFSFIYRASVSPRTCLHMAFSSINIQLSQKLGSEFSAS